MIAGNISSCISLYYIQIIVLTTINDKVFLVMHIIYY
jgi:hypothetical protein